MGSYAWPELDRLEAAGPDELAAALRTLDMIRRRAEVLTAEVVGLADRTGAYALDGHRNVRAWTRAVGNWSHARANAVSRTSRMLHASPVVRDAAHADRLGVEQLQVLARGWANRRAREWFEPCATDLVEQAERLPIGDFTVVARRWEALADPDGCARSHERADLDRDAHLAIVGTQVVIDAHAGVGVGAEMVEIFQRFRDVEFATDWQHGVEHHGENMCPSLMARNDAQRRFDALASIFRAAAGSGRIHTDQPLVNITVDVDTFQHRLDTATGTATPPLDPRTFLQRRCETVDGHQLAGVDVVQAALTGHVRRVVLDGPSVVVDIGRKRRLFTRALRDALDLTDRTCIWPGCDLPARQCQGDHSTPWAAGGNTAADNGGLACAHHNRFKHNNRYRSWRDTNGNWHITRPDGTPINGPPPPIAGA